MIVQPHGMTLHEWADRFAEILGRKALVPRLMDDNWQVWGATLMMNPQVGDVPNPYDFEDWTEWAEYTCEVIQ